MEETLSGDRSRLRVCLGHLDGGRQHQRVQPRSRSRVGASRRGSAAVTPHSVSALGGVVCGCAGGLLGFGLAYWQLKRPSGVSGAAERPLTTLPPPPPSPALAGLAGIPGSDEDDRRYLQLAFDAKAARSPPDHSGFRVTAVIVYADEGGQRHHVIGHNAEVAQPALTGAICAERDAMTTALGSHHSRLASIQKIYIISDAPAPITPGNLCREFLSEYGEPTTPLLMVAASEPSHSSSSSIVSMRATLGELYPHPPILRRVPQGQALQRAADLVAAAGGAPFGPGSDFQADMWPVGKEFCAKLYALSRIRVCSSFASRSLVPLTGNDRCRYERVHALALGSAGRGGDMGSDALNVTGLTDDGIHPMRIAAGAIFSDGKIVATLQRKALEYGCTSDAVVQLMPFLLGAHGTIVDQRNISTPENEHGWPVENGSTGRPVLLMQVDQCGLLHAPAAPARAVLVEHGSGSLCVAVHARDAGSGETAVVCTTAADLAPALPTQMLEMASCP
jgi:cytidine deaminase